jgi:hypothetical protein
MSPSGLDSLADAALPWLEPLPEPHPVSTDADTTTGTTKTNRERSMLRRLAGQC